MSGFIYKSGRLYAEEISLSDIAADIGTPVYVYSSEKITDNFLTFRQAVSGLDCLIAYSVKANSSLAVLKTLARLGAGADVVSGGELERALRAGIEPGKIVFSGVGKTIAEMQSALKSGILQFNVESVPEMIALDNVAKSLGKIAPIALRINPDVQAGGHAKITTGKKENKFGIDIDKAEAVYQQALNMDGLYVRGIDMHIGSQIDKLLPFELAIDKLLDLADRLMASGCRIESFDVGGGLGICYGQKDKPPSVNDYGQMLAEKFAGRNLQIILEPGRAIAGNAGVLLSKVLYIKKGEIRRFLIIDAAMNDLIRPALYDAAHSIRPVLQTGREKREYDIVGPVCETSDTFATFYKLPKMQTGELLVIENVGAYGAVQASQYNSRPLVPEVLVKGDKFALIRPRPDIDEILAGEKIPGWLAGDD